MQDSIVYFAVRKTDNSKKENHPLCKLDCLKNDFQKSLLKFIIQYFPKNQKLKLREKMKWRNGESGQKRN